MHQITEMYEKSSVIAELFGTTANISIAADANCLDLYEQHAQHMVKNGRSPLTPEQFEARMIDAGFEKARKKEKWVFHGIRLAGRESIHQVA